MCPFPFKTIEGAEKYSEQFEERCRAQFEEDALSVLLQGPHNLEILLPRIMEEYLMHPNGDPYQHICNWYLYHPEYDYDMAILRAGQQEDSTTINEMKTFVDTTIQRLTIQDVIQKPQLKKMLAEKLSSGLLKLLDIAQKPMSFEESEAAARALGLTWDVAENANPPFEMEIATQDSLGISSSGTEKDSKNTEETETEEENGKRKVSFDGRVQAVFNGGEMTANSGLLLIKKFCRDMHLDLCFHSVLKIIDSRKKESVTHPYQDIILQIIYTTIAGFYTDDSAKAIASDPTFRILLEKDRVASQPSICRMFQSMDEAAAESLNDVLKAMREIVYVLSCPKVVVFDIDTTHVDTYGHQEDAAYCTHYQSVGYHPLVLFDAITRDPIKAELRPGSEYCSKHASDFLRPVFEEFQEKYPSIRIILRGDSGFAAPEVYDLCEEFGVEYIIRLKENPVLREKFAVVEAEMTYKIQENGISAHCITAENTYKAQSWSCERRVIGAQDKKAGTFIADWIFIVTNFAPGNLSTDNVLLAYRGRGIMETFIGECKRSFGILHVSSMSFNANAARFLVHIIAYAIYNWFSRLAGDELFGSIRSETIRSILFRIPAKVTHNARYTVFHMAENCQYSDLFFAVYDRINSVKSKLNAALEKHQGKLMVDAA